MIEELLTEIGDTITEGAPIVYKHLERNGILTDWFGGGKYRLFQGGPCIYGILTEFCDIWYGVRSATHAVITLKLDNNQNVEEVDAMPGEIAYFNSFVVVPKITHTMLTISGGSDLIVYGVTLSDECRLKFYRRWLYGCDSLKRSLFRTEKQIMRVAVRTRRVDDKWRTIFPGAYFSLLQRAAFGMFQPVLMTAEQCWLIEAYKEIFQALNLRDTLVGEYI